MNVGQRGEALREIVTGVREQEYDYEKRPKKRYDLAPYDRAQINEVADVVELIRVAVDAAAKRLEERENASGKKKPRRGRGRPPVPAEDKLRGRLYNIRMLGNLVYLKGLVVHPVIRGTAG